MRNMLKSKLHRARVTEANLTYEGSITIDKTLMEAADIIEYERVDVLNINNGARFSTYAIEGVRDSGVICLNGAAARLAAPDDLVIILTYHDLPEEEAIKAAPRLVYVDSQNRITGTKNVDRAESLLSQLQN